MIQDLSILPTLGLEDIPKEIPFVDAETKMIGGVKVHFFD